VLDETISVVDTRSGRRLKLRYEASAGTYELTLHRFSAQFCISAGETIEVVFVGVLLNSSITLHEDLDISDIAILSKSVRFPSFTGSPGVGAE